MPPDIIKNYHIEVSHDIGDFHSDMDFSTSNSEEAFEHYKKLKEKYRKNKVTIQEVTEIRFIERITAEQLEDRIF